MKILLVHPSDELYGADRVLLETACSLLEDNDVEVWLPTDVDYPERRLSARLENLGVPVSFVTLPVLRRANGRVRSLPRLLIRLITTGIRLRRARPDLVYISTSALAPLAILTSVLRVRSVIHVHEYLRGVEAAVLGLMFMLTSRVICVSKFVQSRVLPLARRRSLVIYNGFALPPASELPQGDLTFVLASRWNTWKGHEEFLMGWEQANLAGAVLRIYGGPPRVGGKTDVPLIVSKMRNRATVQIFGERPDITGAMAASHVVVVPSLEADPLPTIAIEALAAGRPVLCASIGGLPEIVAKGRTGWVVAEPKSAEWAAALRRINLSDIRIMSAEGPKVFRDRFQVSRYRVEARAAVLGSDCSVQRQIRGAA